VSSATNRVIPLGVSHKPGHRDTVCGGDLRRNPMGVGGSHRAFGHDCRRSQCVGVNAAAWIVSGPRIRSHRRECALLCEGAETSTASRLSGCENTPRSRFATRAARFRHLFGGGGLTGTALNKCESQTRLNAGPLLNASGPSFGLGYPRVILPPVAARRSALSGAGGAFAARV